MARFEFIFRSENHVRILILPVSLQFYSFSVSVEPLYPHLCARVPTWPPSPSPDDDEEENEEDGDDDEDEQGRRRLSGQTPRHKFTPIELSNQLNSLPCSLRLGREECASLTQLIGHSRHFMINARNCLQFYLCCCLSLSLAQLGACMLLLPSLFSPGQLLWMLCFLFPLLSHSLIASQSHPQLMTLATGKNLNLSREVIFADDKLFFTCGLDLIEN